MELTRLQKMEAEPVDEATKALIEAAQAQGRRGETVTLEEAFEYAERKYRDWCRVQQEVTDA